MGTGRFTDTHPQRHTGISTTLVSMNRPGNLNHLTGPPLADSVVTTQILNHGTTTEGLTTFFGSRPEASPCPTTTPQPTSSTGYSPPPPASNAAPGSAQTTVRLLPTVKRVLRNTPLPNNIHHRSTRLRLIQHRRNLLYTKSLPLHGKHLHKKKVCRKLTSKVDQNNDSPSVIPFRLKASGAGGL